MTSVMKSVLALDHQWKLYCKFVKNGRNNINLYEYDFVGSRVLRVCLNCCLSFDMLALSR